MDIFVNDITLSFLQWFLVSLISFLLGLFLGWWLWHKYRQLYIDLEAGMKKLETRNVELEADLNSWKYKYEELEQSTAAKREALKRCEADKAVLEFKLAKCQKTLEDTGGGDGGGSLAAAAPKVSGTRSGGTRGVTGLDYSGIFSADDLKIVEGIGPKIEEVLKAAGISDWKTLASTSPDKIKEVLVAAAPHYRIHDPSTWPSQAEMAMKGEWGALVASQKDLDAGKEKEGDGETPSKIEKMAMRILGFSNDPQDLKIIEGIGPKIEQLLKKGGINSWSDLASTSVDKIQKILDEAGDKYRLASPDTWPKQASLAAAGQWSELSKYQDDLKGGKEA